MTYRRRYLSGQSATTVVIAEGAITSDKIVDKAVTTPKVDDDAITSEKIADESILSEDIKAGEVKTSDIAPGAVTTEKIADSAVTSDKLEASIREITRPLTPGIDTDEIQDAKVTLAKLAPDSVDASKIKPGAVTASELNPDAVETVKIKDAAVTTDKIAPGAVTENKVGANAITGSKILNRSVGNTEIAVEGCHRENIKDEAVNTVKLAAEAVTAAKLADDAVIGPKLAVAAIERRHITGLRNRNREIIDEFLPHDLSGRWVTTGDAGGLITQGSTGLGLQTKAVNGTAQRLDWGGFKIPFKTLSNLPNMVVGVHRPTSNTFVTLSLGLYKDVNNLIEFYAHDDAGAAANWQARCIKGGVSTLVDTGITIRPDVDKIRLLELVVIGPTSVKFYVDGVEKAHIETAEHIMDERFEPRLKVITRQAGVAYLYLDYFQLLSGRAAFV
ncbi:hypothetical protein ES703_57746 [subsurface metagenome]